jgi:hypothetical protein
MHKRYAKDGLAVLAVCLDDSTDTRARAGALRFLRSQRPAFPTLLLEDRPRSAMRREFGFDSLPCVFVYDRVGRRQKFEGAFGFEDVERLVAGYVKSSPQP